MGKYNPDVKEGEVGFPLVALAIDKDKGSQNALKWAIDNLLSKGQTLVLVHVNTKVSSFRSQEDPGGFKQPTDPHTKEIYLPFRCYCTRKDIHCKDVVLEDTDIAKAIIEFAAHAAIEKLVVGAPSKGGFIRFKNTDIPTHISKGAPDFCTVYVISKSKVFSVRNAVRPAPAVSPLRAQIQPQPTPQPNLTIQNMRAPKGDSACNTPLLQQKESIKSPFTRGLRGSTAKSYADFAFMDSSSDISFVSSGRPSVDRYQYPPRLSSGSEGLDRSFETVRTPQTSVDSYSTRNDFSSFSQSSGGSSWSSQAFEDVESEMRRLRLQLKQTMDMYSTACKEALIAKQKAMELHRWKVGEEQRLEEARVAEGTALALAEKEKAKCKAAIEAAEASQRIAELEAQKRINAEMNAIKEAEENERAFDAFKHTVRYRKYTIEEIELATDYFSEDRKIGEGGYGPVFKCYLDHTPVAVKVLRPDAAQGRAQFQQEVEILSCIRHPNMVLLLGACPEYGCLVYENMLNGSLEDRLFRYRGSSSPAGPPPPPLLWPHRFRIAAEVATALLFLHQTKPEPLVHRDLKPANVLLDRHLVSKIGDVGLARLVPPPVADAVTQYRITAAAGTFCYIDPEYQQTGMLGVKSDVYSLGIMILQILTAKPPMGLAHHVERAMEEGRFAEVLDAAAGEWPVDEARRMAEVGLRCAELRRKDRPDLATVVLPELDRLRAVAEESMPQYGGMAAGSSAHSSPLHSQVSQYVMSDPLLNQSGYSSRTHSSGSSIAGRRSDVM
ncbi:U-box domain-containing protein 51-like isoform X2 [Ananas comosus]|uniref:RING-type E3 ubiquitin transferase n=1 Tax=Ananas comosus TaxID=4615 RepID=A0A6P5GJY7_ANACO|nr:U-box domain-containing protein 51-like isoform X2 [Ananas comosus]